MRTPARVSCSSRDLGIDPSPELQDLERRILAQDRELLISVGPTVQRRAVLVADLDDAGWRDPWERDTAYGRRDDDLEAAAATEGGTKLSPRGTAGLRRLRRCDQCRASGALDRERRHSDRDRRRRSRDARRRTGRSTAGTCRPTRRHRPSRTGPPVVGGPRRARRRRADRVGRRIARAVRHRRARPCRPRLPTRRPRVRLGLPAAARRPTATTGPGWRRTLGAGLRVASADRHRTARRGASGVPAVGRPRGRAAHLRPGDGVPSAVRASLRDRIAADHPRRASSCRSAARLLARAEPSRDGESLDDRRQPRPNGSRRTASARHRRSRSWRRSHPRWRPPTATAWCTGGSARRTCCSTPRTTPSWRTWASTRSARE